MIKSFKLKNKEFFIFEINIMTELFIEKATIIHGDKYDYSNVNYKNNSTKIIIICKEHGEFEQTPNNHLYGYGCGKCAKNTKIKKVSLLPC
jgi:hypothetical protein